MSEMLIELTEVRARVAKLVDNDLKKVDTFMSKRQPALDWKSPNTLIQFGRADLVMRFLNNAIDERSLGIELT